MYRNKSEIADRLAELRRDRSLQQREVADRLGIGVSAISRIETGERGLAAEELATLADLYAVSIDSILRVDDEAFAFRSTLDDDATAQVEAILDKVYDDFFALRTAAS